jgi:hypothetical protein
LANNLATLKTALAVSLSDPTFGYWTAAEMEGLVTDAVENLWPRYGQRIHGQTVTVVLVPGTSFYTIPAGVAEIDSIQWIDSSGVFQDFLPEGTWFPTFDGDGVNSLQINEAYASQGGTLRLSGLRKYDVTTVLVPDNLVDLVISLARAEAYRRALGDRMRFKQWATTNQIQNVSVNEMLGIINESERKAAELRTNTPRTQRRPVPARV